MLRITSITRQSGLGSANPITSFAVGTSLNEGHPREVFVINDGEPRQDYVPTMGR